MAKLDELFRIMVKRKASDLHLSSGSAPVLRICGDTSVLNSRVFNHEEYKALIYEILNKDQIKRFEEDMELDCAYEVPECGRFRCNVFMQRLGISAVFRHIPQEILSMETVGLPSVVNKILKEHKGLVCVTGPTGSGKSTTLAAMIDHLNETCSGHILTIEDPIEFVYKSKKCLINQREVRNNTHSFASALRAALREDPDIILVGEMRDIETISLAVTAAETGHLVFGTLHTMSAPKTVDRIINSFPEGEQNQIRVMLSESLKAVISQTLLKRVDTSGRVAAHEVMINNNAIHNLIREGKTYQIHSTMQISKHTGMQTLEMDIERLFKSNIISSEDAARYLKGNVNSNDKNQTSQQKTNPQTQFGTNKQTGIAAKIGNLQTQLQQRSLFKKSS